MYKIGETPHIKGFPEELSHLLSSVTGWCRGCRCKTLSPGFCAVSCASRDCDPTLFSGENWVQVGGSARFIAWGVPPGIPSLGKPCPAQDTHRNPPALPEPGLSSAPAHLPQAPAPKNHVLQQELGFVSQGTPAPLHGVFGGCGPV